MPGTHGSPPLLAKEPLKNHSQLAGGLRHTELSEDTVDSAGQAAERNHPPSTSVMVLQACSAVEWKCPSRVSEWSVCVKGAVILPCLYCQDHMMTQME
ncbi:hypothetical protein AOLI_G00300210 [Acnodon oligacanthus]